jgi:hypothetical protein
MIEYHKNDDLPRVKSTSSEMIFFELQYIALGKAGFILVDKQALLKSRKHYEKLGKRTASGLWREGARWVLNFTDDELLSAGSPKKDSGSLSR